MRRVRNPFEPILDRDNLRLAVYKALRGKRGRREARAFIDGLDERLVAILSGGVLPPRAVGDAARVAVAAFHKVDDLLTWNCRANAQIMGRIALVCQRLGLHMPIICTPEELMGE